MSVAEVVAEPADSAQAVAVAAVAAVEREIADAERKVANLRRAIAEEDHPELAALLREDMAAALAARGAAVARRDAIAEHADEDAASTTTPCLTPAAPPTATWASC